MARLGRVGLAALLCLALSGAGCSKEPKCPAGQAACNGTCVETNTVDNCLYCGARCPSGASCTSSGCQCPAGWAACTWAQCVSLSADPNCGACGVTCGGLGACSTATSPAACSCGAYTLCPSASPQCVDTSTNASNCGACGYSCGLGSCSGGVCTCNAGVGIADCGSGTSPQCVNTFTDDRNCGACGNACPSGQDCSAGHCCSTGLTWCGTACVNESTDPSNCGGCGNLCAGTCSAGHCCPTGLAWCGTACVDESSDPSNCGACGNICGSGQSCTQGICCAGAVCGSTPACCQGSACCGGNVCPPPHPDGLGQSYYDCAQLGTPGDENTYNPQMAQEAAAAWAPTGARAGLTCGTASCVSNTTAGSPQDCAVWCYTGTLAGYVGHSSTPTIACSAVCPTVGSGGSATWQ